ncbi:MAG: HAD hydrolase-like protein [Beijerinckiaceae bacterium]
MQKIIVFDLDGTLAETAGDLIATLNVILAREEIGPVPLAEGRKMVGAGARALIQRGFERAGRDIEGPRLEKLFDDFIAHYEANIANESHLFDGVEAALDNFAAEGWLAAVCTNKIEAPSRHLLGALGAAHRFAAICGQDTFRAGTEAIFKPDPRALLMTIAKAGGDPQRAVMVGDSRTDIDTAKAASVPVVAVDFGYTDRHVSEFAPNAVISHFDELAAAVADLKIG